MAEHDQHDRTESPTAKRQEDARRRGQVPRSRDLSAAAVTLAGGFGLYNLGQLLGGGMLRMMHSSFEIRAAQAMDSNYMLASSNPSRGAAATTACSAALPRLASM